MYLVIQCYLCGGYLIAKVGQKTRCCPYCNHRLVIEKAKKLLYRKTLREASEALRVVKMEASKRGM